jgi:hypothetical protein
VKKKILRLCHLYFKYFQAKPYIYSYPNISGPLMFKTSKNVHILVGVVSFGPQGCGDPTLPNVFARVTEVLGWIFSVMKPSAKTCLPTETDLKARLYYL